jgi:hypothetical protein
VRVGGITGVVVAADDEVCGRVWVDGRSIAVGASVGSGEIADVADQGDKSQDRDQ